MKKKIDRNISGTFRIVLVALMIFSQILLVIFLQALLIIFLVWMLNQYTISVYVLIQILSIINIIFLVTKSKNRCYTVAWLLVIFILPVFGHILHMLWGRASNHGWKNNRLKPAIARGNEFLAKDPKVYAELGTTHPTRKRIGSYLGKIGFPLYKGTKCEYYPLGELQFEAMLKDLEEAKKFIFLEYFILNIGQLWGRIEEILIRKAAEGVEVRLMIDDLGSITTISDSLVRDLRAKNIQVIRFNPIHRYISRFSMNYRNHRKITVIDGNVAYTGGTNIADEYANIYPKYGHWKDTAIRLEGDAVWSLTVTFLQMWESESNAPTDYEAYRPSITSEEKGFYQPFSDGPVNNPNNPAEIMYRTIINNAKEYVYITTPYLIIDNAMIEALCTAAQGGIDVRIITPKIWDRWYVHMVTESNFGELLKSGVKIYEYTPGYIHAKNIISDGDHAIIGSINMDYRSFHLNFENGVWICDAPVLKDIEKDIIETCKIGREVGLDEWLRRPWYIKCMETILRLFSVLL